MKKKNTEHYIDPRQGWFKNKNEALKQFIERVNLVPKDNIVVDDKDISELNLSNHTNNNKRIV